MENVWYTLHTSLYKKTYRDVKMLKYLQFY